MYCPQNGRRHIQDIALPSCKILTAIGCTTAQISVTGQRKTAGYLLTEGEIILHCTKLTGPSLNSCLLTVCYLTHILSRHGHLLQARSKPDIVNRPVRTARTFVHRYNSTQYWLKMANGQSNTLTLGYLVCHVTTNA